MAGLACPPEAASVRICMAALAIDKSNSFVMGLGFPRLGAVTLRAGHALVKPGEWVVRARMIKSSGRLPGVLAVAAQAVCA